MISVTSHWKWEIGKWASMVKTLTRIMEVPM